MTSIKGQLTKGIWIEKLNIVIHKIDGKGQFKSCHFNKLDFSTKKFFFKTYQEQITYIFLIT